MNKLVQITATIVMSSSLIMATEASERHSQRNFGNDTHHQKTFARHHHSQSPRNQHTSTYNGHYQRHNKHKKQWHNKNNRVLRVNHRRQEAYNRPRIMIQLPWFIFVN